MASEVCRMIHDLHLNDHSIGTSVEEKVDASKGVRGGSKVDGDSFICGEPAMTAEEDDDISDEDSDSDSHLFDKPVATGASGVEKGDAEEDDDISDEDSDSDSHFFDKPVATEEDTTQDSDDDYGYYRCVGCTEPDSAQTYVLNHFYQYDSERDGVIGMTMEEIDAILDRGDITMEHIQEVFASLGSP